MICMLIFCFKFNKLVFLLLGVEMLVLGLIMDFVFVMDMFLFFYFLCFCVISSVVGLGLYGSLICGLGGDKYFFLS
uniref:NADH dehydrogenase subunit 4L n=1 Tax=Physaloptera rara TaxID=2358290 RepID=A0A4Y6I427_9BILA|nr:NADH dehydrogenase subunit 4L [Physaloptera rara]